MALTEAQMARELKLSRSVINDNVRAGMPLESVEAAQHWRRRHVRPKYHPNSLAARCPKPLTPGLEPPDDSESDELHDPCPDLPMNTPRQQVAKYILWGLYGRGVCRATAEWIASHLLTLVADGKGDVEEPTK
jgi:hypothetical protein